MEDSLFEADILDSVMFSMERAYVTFKDSMSLKEEAQIARRCLMHASVLIEVDGAMNIRNNRVTHNRFYKQCLTLEDYFKVSFDFF